MRDLQSATNIRSLAITKEIHCNSIFTMLLSYIYYISSATVKRCMAIFKSPVSGIFILSLFLCISIGGIGIDYSIPTTWNRTKESIPLLTTTKNRIGAEESWFQLTESDRINTNVILICWSVSIQSHWLNNKITRLSNW